MEIEKLLSCHLMQFVTWYKEEKYIKREMKIKNTLNCECLEQKFKPFTIAKESISYGLKTIIHTLNNEKYKLC